MSGQVLKLGPFRGGLNNVSDATSIKDDELSLCTNFDYDVDGSLISRPPITQDSQTGPVANQVIDILGHFVHSDGTVYTVGASNNNVYYKTTGAWSSITTGVKASAATQYLSKMWIVADPDSSNSGGSWDPSAGFTAVATMPRGSAIITFKERLWIAAGKKETTNGSRLYFSAIANGSSWGAADFFDINPGDGQHLIDIVSVSTNMYLFKNQATYVMQYDSSPARATITPISRTIGVDDIRCIAQYENILYVYCDGYLYELINYQYNKVNTRVNLAENAAGSYVRPATVSIVGNRVVVGYYNNIFVFYTITRTWSKWEVNTAIGKLWQIPYSATGSTPYSYIANANVSGNRSTFTFVDGYIAGRTESAEASMATKIYDFNAPNMYKKLYWWGVDTLMNGTVTASVIPVLYNASVTWAQMASFTWADVASLTWNRPGNTDQTISQIIVSTSAERKFLKIYKSCRFRNAYFSLVFTVTDWEHPVRVFSITPVLQMKEGVVKTVN